MWDSLCHRMNVRMIVPDRPGMGLSTYVPDRTVSEYPEDIANLASHLGWNKYSILGGSGGAPYVLSCARFLPSQSLDRMGIVAGSAPPEAGSKGLGMLGRGAQYFFSHFPRFVAWSLENSLVKAAKDSDPAIFEKEILRARSVLNESDKAAFDEDAQWIVAAMREVYNKSADGPAWDLYLMTQPWGFKLEDISHPVKLWCGTEDKNTPLNMSRHMAWRLPKAELKALKGLTHFTIFSSKHMDGIFNDFLGGT